MLSYSAGNASHRLSSPWSAVVSQVLLVFSLAEERRKRIKYAHPWNVNWFWKTNGSQLKYTPSNSSQTTSHDKRNASVSGLKHSYANLNKSLIAKADLRDDSLAWRMFSISAAGEWSYSADLRQESRIVNWRSSSAESCTPENENEQDKHYANGPELRRQTNNCVTVSWKEV